MKNYCCDRPGQKSAQKGVKSGESDFVTPESGTVRGPEPEPALDVRSTFVAEVTYKQVVFSSGVPCGEGARGEGEKEWGGIERGSGGKQGKGGEGGGQGQEEEEEEEEGEGEGPAGEGTLSEKEKAEQVEDETQCVFHMVGGDAGKLQFNGERP